MERRGVLKSWDDGKGFGFIQPEEGDEQLFVHISAMRSDRRPKTGETVLFIAGRDREGRARARPCAMPS
ncbi:cold shock domain-containing protein [Azotobacter armeniacus]